MSNDNRAAYLIRTTIHLKHCWVCTARDGLHQHHVIPQSYGGRYGPTVTLCGLHHTFIHNLDKNNQYETEVYKHSADYDDRLDVVPKLCYLISCIRQARQAVAASKLKKKKIPLELEAVEAAMLDWLKKALGAPSQTFVLRRLVREKYQLMMGQDNNESKE